jgi:hypothetical protein
MRVLCLGLDGADYDLVRDLLAEGKLPTLDRRFPPRHFRAAPHGSHSIRKSTLRRLVEDVCKP